MARGALDAHVGTDDQAAADAAVAGRRRLPCEGPAEPPEADSDPPVPPTSPFGKVVKVHQRPGLELARQAVPGSDNGIA